MKIKRVILICFLFFFCSTLAFASDTVVFTFKDNREQRVTLTEPACSIKSIIFHSTSATSKPTDGKPYSGNDSACTSYPIKVISAKYGDNCKANYNVARVAKDCNGKSECHGIINNEYAGSDPAPGCGKDFRIKYSCGSTAKSYYVPGKLAEGGPWSLSCKCSDSATHTPPIISSSNKIAVVSGTYGTNCNASYGNKTTHLANTCNAKPHCVYSIEVAVIGDPASNCAKDYIAEWRCGGDQTVHKASIKPEATGQHVILKCPQ